MSRGVDRRGGYSGSCRCGLFTLISGVTVTTMSAIDSKHAFRGRFSAFSRSQCAPLTLPPHCLRTLRTPLFRPRSTLVRCPLDAGAPPCIIHRLNDLPPQTVQIGQNLCVEIRGKRLRIIASVQLTILWNTGFADNLASRETSRAILIPSDFSRRSGSQRHVCL